MIANIDIKSPLEVVGREPRPAQERRGVYLTVATPGYFEAMSIPLREGRLLDDRDAQRTPVVGVISEALRRDPLTFLLVSGLLGAVGLAACYLPARRATHVDPLMALRVE